MKNCFNWILNIKFKRNSKIINYPIENIIIHSNIECCVCYNIYDKDEIKAFIPCGHRVCCNNCIEEIKYNKKNCCPICNADIKDKIKIYENIIQGK